MSVDMKVRGKDRLFAKLRAIEPSIGTEVEKANDRTADELVATARRFAPRRTGALARSIRVTKGGQSSQSHSHPGGKRRVPDGSRMVTAGDASVRYAHLVEYGARPHSNSGQFAGTEHPGSVAQPFFWPAYRIVSRKHRGRVSRAINKAVKKVSRR